MLCLNSLHQRDWPLGTLKGTSRTEECICKGEGKYVNDFRKLINICYVYSGTINEYVCTTQYINRNCPVLSMHNILINIIIKNACFLILHWCYGVSLIFTEVLVTHRFSSLEAHCSALHIFFHLSRMLAFFFLSYAQSSHFASLQNPVCAFTPIFCSCSFVVFFLSKFSFHSFKQNRKISHNPSQSSWQRSSYHCHWLKLIAQQIYLLSFVYSVLLFSDAELALIIPVGQALESGQAFSFPIPTWI